MKAEIRETGVGKVLTLTPECLYDAFQLGKINLAFRMGKIEMVNTPDRIEFNSISLRLYDVIGLLADYADDLALRHQTSKKDSSC